MPDAVWARTQLVYVCSPDNPTGRVTRRGRVAAAVRAVRPPRLRDRRRRVLFGNLLRRGRLRRWARWRSRTPQGRHGFPRLVVFGSLSKRSNAPGLRSGYVAGDAALIKAFLLLPDLPRLGDVAGGRRTPASPRGTTRRTCAPTAPRTPRSSPRCSRGSRRCCPARCPKPRSTCGRAPTATTRRSPGACSPRQNVTVLPGSYLARDAHGVNPGARVRPHRAGRAARPNAPRRRPDRRARRPLTGAGMRPRRRPAGAEPAVRAGGARFVGPRCGLSPAALGCRRLQSAA